jgi:glycosyltransferase involved in cell wall biosynthesis
MKPEGLATESDLRWRQNGSRAAPAVTVLMSVYNGEKYVGEAIESILRQTWTDFEFLIVNDGSNDHTREIITSFRDERIRLLDNPVSLGLTKSLNLGLASARGALVARQDADDVSHPVRLAAQVEFMRSNPGVALVGAQARILNERGHASCRPGWERALTDTAIRFQLMFDNAFIHPSVLFRRAVVWEQLGGYDESFVTSQDFELWSRIAARYHVRNLPQPLVDYRFHSGSVGALYRSAHLDLSRAVVAANLSRYLQLARVPDKWPRLISSLHADQVSCTKTELVELAAVVCEIYERFLECYPEEKTNREIRGVLAGKMSQVACRLAVKRRRTALRVFNCARRFDSQTARSFALKFFSLLLCGERLRSLLRLYAQHGL